PLGGHRAPDGIAVGAAVGTGIVGPYIAAFRAEAAGAVALRSADDSIAGEIGEALRVDAAGALDPLGQELGLAAQGEAHASLRGDARQIHQEGALRTYVGIGPIETRARRGRVEIPARLAIWRHEREIGRASCRESA